MNSHDKFLAGCLAAMLTLFALAGLHAQGEMDTKHLEHATAIIQPPPSVEVANSTPVARPDLLTLSYSGSLGQDACANHVRPDFGLAEWQEVCRAHSISEEECPGFLHYQWNLSNNKIHPSFLPPEHCGD